MQIMILGGILGYLTGAGAWLGARYLVAGYLPPDDRTHFDWGLRSLLADARGSLSVWAALTQAGLVSWGVLLGWRAPMPGQLVPGLVVTGLLVTISLVDFQVRRIPNVLVLALLVWALVQFWWLGQVTMVAVGLGVLVGGGLMLVVAVVGRGAMGAGDVKLAAALGALLGYPLVISGLFLGILAGGVGALVILLTRRGNLKGTMAYGPYLALGGWVAFVSMLVTMGT